MAVHQPVTPAKELTSVHLRHARVVHNRHAILEDLPKHGVVAEVGVAFGDFSQSILRVLEPRLFYAIDLFDLHQHATAFGVDLQQKFQGRTHEQFIRERFQAQIDAGIVLLAKGDSARVMEAFDDGVLDVIYIDASHEYHHVKKDLTVSGRKIKPSGALVLNDYTMANPTNGQQYGVVQATHEFCLDEGWEITHLALHPRMFCDVVLRKMGV